MNGYGDFNSLTFLVMYERGLGEKSEFYPIFKITPESYSIIDWEEDDFL